MEVVNVSVVRLDEVPMMTTVVERRVVLVNGPALEEMLGMPDGVEPVLSSVVPGIEVVPVTGLAVLAPLELRDDAGAVPELPDGEATPEVVAGPVEFAKGPTLDEGVEEPDVTAVPGMVITVVEVVVLVKGPALDEGLGKPDVTPVTDKIGEVTVGAVKLDDVLVKIP